MPYLLDSSATLEQRSSTYKDFYNYKLFVFLSHTLYISNRQIVKINLSCLYAFPTTDNHPPNKGIFLCSFIDFEMIFSSLDISLKEGTSLWLGKF